jgi:hypothetical protein
VTAAYQTPVAAAVDVTTAGCAFCMLKKKTKKKQTRPKRHIARVHKCTCMYCAGVCGWGVMLADFFLIPSITTAPSPTSPPAHRPYPPFHRPYTPTAPPITGPAHPPRLPSSSGPSPTHTPPSPSPTHTPPSPYTHTRCLSTPLSQSNHGIDRYRIGMSTSRCTMTII